MLEWIISSSALIAVIIALRYILKGKISLRLQYALWTLALVRLLLPVSIGSSSISIMNRVENSQVYQDVIEPEINMPQGNAPVVTIPSQPAGGVTVPSAPNTEAPPAGLPGGGAPAGNSGQVEQSGQSGQNEQTGQTAPSQTETPPAQEMPPAQTESGIDWAAALRFVWISGSVVLGMWFVVSNLVFSARLRKSRCALQTSHKLPVYVCGALDTPCLFGFFRPAIYLTEEVAADERAMRYAAEHELTHHRHLDHIWAVVRCVCLAAHWYNPLVWWAAILSKNDAELACDESTIRRLGEGERAEYGRTLLRLTCEKRTAILNTATTMTGSAKTIKERIALIVKKPKMAIYTLIAVVLIAAIAVACTFTGAKDKPHSFTKWTESLSVEDIQLAEVSKEYGNEKISYTIPESDYEELCTLLKAISDDDCSRKKPEGNNEDGYRLVLYRADKLWLFKCLDDGTVALMFNDEETGAYFGCEGTLLIIESQELWAFIVKTVEEKGTDSSDPTDENEGNEVEISEEIAYLLNLLETVKVEDVTGYSNNMQADTEIIVPLINAAAATYAGEYEMEYEWEWHIDLHLAERNDDSGYSPELIGFHIGISEGIVDVSCRLNPDTDPSDYVYIRLHSEELWDYIFSLYNPGGIDQHALSLYEEILAERAAQTIAYHSTYLVPQGFPELTGYEITYLRLVDSFHYGYSFRVYSFDIAYLTDDPDPGRYGWPQDAGPDEQGRIRRYDLSIYFIAAHAHDDLVDFRFFQDCEAYGLPLNFRMDIVESFTGEELCLGYESGANRTHIYTRDGVSIAIPYNFEHLVEAHKDIDTWCYGLIMNPTYYWENPYLTDQTLFNLFHLCEYNEDGDGLIFSIRRYTEEEYERFYLNSYSRQRVFARDDTYYYCVFIPTDERYDDPLTAAIIEELLNQQLGKILPDMIERNGWQAYDGEEENNVQFIDMSVVPTNYHQIFDLRMQEIMNRHNETCEERNQCAFTGYHFLTFDLKDTFTRDGAEYLIYHWEVAFLTNDPDADESSWVGSTFVDDQNRINYYDTDTFFVVCREKDHFKWDFFHYDLYSDPKDVVFDLLAEHFAALEMEEQELYIAAHNRLSALTAEDIRNVSGDVRDLNVPELAQKISAAMEHHTVWPTGAVFPWNLDVLLMGSAAESMTLSAYERENIVEIRYYNKDGNRATLVCEDEALYWYVRWLCGDDAAVARMETQLVLTLPSEEMDALCAAALNDLKTRWWTSEELADCAYEAGAFECVYREVSGSSLIFYGYAGYFCFDENGEYLNHWYAASIITLDAVTLEATEVWWPGDGAAYEEDVHERFPDEIDEIVAEPNTERAQVVRDRLLETAKAQISQVTEPDAATRLKNLTAEDIKHTAGFSEVDASEIAALLAAAENRIDRTEGVTTFWSLEIYLSGGPDVYNTGTDEWIFIYAGPEKNIVQINHHSESGKYTTLYFEDEALYHFVRGMYTTEEFVDEEAYARFGDILEAKAKESVERSEESANEFYPIPYTGFEIVYLKKLETFEHGGRTYEVYEWDVAFLHDDPIKAGLAGGMWIDSELRVRSLEGDIYFVLCTSGDTVEHDFFFWDLYFGPDEETGRENAHSTIAERFANAS